MSQTARFGVFEFDPLTRDLKKHGVRLKVQQQPLQILAVLLERAGQIVTREELQRAVWANGTFVEYEQSLNKAVNKLREALGDSADHPLYVETVPRRGYRFVAPVEFERTAAPTMQIRRAEPPKRRTWAVIAIALLGTGLITGLWPPPEPRIRVTQLTSDGLWKFPALFVGSNALLYTASTANALFGSGTGEFWSVSTSGGTPHRQPSPCLEDETPFISGISYLHKRILVNCHGGSGHNLWLTGFDGDNAKPMGRYFSDAGIFISPDLKTLLLYRNGLLGKSMDTGEERLLTPVDWKFSGSPFFPFWHPSSERIAFPELDGETMKLWEVSSQGGNRKRLVPAFPAEQRSGQWSSDGRRLYFVSQKDIYVEAERRWPLGWARKPSFVRLTAGSIRFDLPFEDPANPLVLYAWGEVPGGQLMKLSRRTGAFEPYLNGLPADCLDYSPDGKWIAYVDFPSGALWKCKIDGTGRVMLDDSLLLHYMPRWSPDGTQIAFAAGRVAGGQFRIYTIAAAGSNSTPVPGVSGPGFDPTWSPDGKRLAFAPLPGDAETNAQKHASIVNLETRQISAVPGSEELFSMRWSPDGTRLAALGGASEPFVYDFKTNAWMKLRSGCCFSFPHWSKDSRYLYGIDDAKGPRLVRFEVATRKFEPIRAITEFSTIGLLYAGAYWTPDDEPVVLKDTSSYQIYRIERNR